LQLRPAVTETDGDESGNGGRGDEQHLDAELVDAVTDAEQHGHHDERKIRLEGRRFASAHVVNLERTPRV